eukprot:TRINITY_DN683_c0_g1_i2.p1 TRINITY_DN683_c0_g1~~TRINITY_DN683_c0_g1_i2.p1  ORF type:complete len:193 (+),score=50.16 TRINITY_DN683_c0_g1_i2:69-647(+)
MSKSVLVPIADGSEDIETVCIIDVLRRASIDVTVASVAPQQSITAARGTRITADCLISDCAAKDFDFIALPGGLPGAKHLAENEALIQMLKSQKSSNKGYGAICASPALVLQHHGLIDGMEATCYPAFQEKIPAYRQDNVVISGNCITSRGPATAISFSLAIVQALVGREKADAVAKGMLWSLDDVPEPAAN